MDMFETVIEARARLFEEAETPGGGICPCCDRFTKIYVRKFNKSMAEGIIWLCGETWAGRTDPDGYVSVGARAPRVVMRSSCSVSNCIWYDLVEAKPNEDDDSKRCSGLWRTTPQGTAFVRGELSIPSHVRTYNHQVLGFVEKQWIDIEDALGRPFHYRELMNETSE